MSDFKIGDKAVYPTHGVAEVVGIEKKEINASLCSFYILKVIATGMQIMVPREKAEQVGLRALATTSGCGAGIGAMGPLLDGGVEALRKQFETNVFALIGVTRACFPLLRDPEVHIDKQTWNRRQRGFMEKIKTGSLFDVAEVYRDLFRLKSTKVLSFGERKMLDHAKQLIVKELAVARKWPEDKVEKELEKACA